MDCRKFHKNLEDYLEDGLDFAGRFTMERHARQCIGCGNEMAGAQKLRRMARKLGRVKAPADFESALLNEIGRHKVRGRFSGFRKLWFYGLEFPSMRKAAAAMVSLMVLSIGIYYFSNSAKNGTTTVSSPVVQTVRLPQAAPVAQAPEPAGQSARVLPAVSTAAQIEALKSRLRNSRPAEVPQRAEMKESRKIEQEPIMEEQGTVQAEYTDYIEYQMFGPGNRPVSFRVPNNPRVRYGQSQEEHFIRNVSH